jgi:hypothetical protein
LTGLDLSVLQIKTKIVGCLTADSKPVKQEVNSTMILPPFSIPWLDHHDQIQADSKFGQLPTENSPWVYVIKPFISLHSKLVHFVSD